MKLKSSREFMKLKYQIYEVEMCLSDSLHVYCRIPAVKILIQNFLAV